MKFKNYKIKILVMIFTIIGISFLFSTSAFAIPDWQVGPSEPYQRGLDEYCGAHTDGHNDVLFPTSNASLGSIAIQYDGGSSEPLDPAVGYARYAGYSDAQLQAVIWDHTTNNQGVQTSSGPQRPKDYKTVYNEIFSKLGKNPLIKTNTKEEDLKILVDRKNGTYTVGPYNIELNVEASSTAVNLLYNELTQTHDHPFAVFSGIGGVNGTDIEILDKDGNQIKSSMPKFGQDFYLRFKPNAEGAITTTGKPKFVIRYISGFNGDVTRYKEVAVKANLSITGYAKSTSVDEGNVSWNGVYGGPNQTVTEYGSATIPVTYEATVTSDYFESKTVTKTENVTVQFQRTVSFDEYGNIQYISYPDQTTRVPSTSVITKSLETFTGAKKLQDIIKINSSAGDSSAIWAESILELPESKVNMQLGGKVWKDVEQGPKSLKLNGIKDEDEEWFAGIQVCLYEVNGETPVATTTTDKNGVYRFFGYREDEGGHKVLIVNPLKEYYVVFIYNGQRYESTYYKNDLTGGFSNAKDMNREEFNQRFETISAYPNNYENTIAFSWEQKIKDKDGNYIEYNGDALRFKDVYDKFLDYATNNDFTEPTKNDAITKWEYGKNYSQSQEFIKWLKGTQNESNQVIADSEIEAIKTFINDTLMGATTHVEKVTYSVYDKFVLENIDKNSEDYKSSPTKSKRFGSDTYTYIYSTNSDQARNVDFGLHERVKTNLAIQKDIYKATVIVNGKKEDYIYNKKRLNEDGVWTVNVRASDYNYSPNAVYERPIKASDYLYDGQNDTANAELRKLKIYVTYRITVRNIGDTKAIITGIKDYFNPEQYTHDRNDKLVDINTYSGMQNFNVGDAVEAQKAEKKGDITTKQESDKISGACLYITGLEKNLLEPSNYSTVYVTFKVNNDQSTGKIQLGGKKNIAEINGYKTYYNDNQTIPDTLDKDNNTHDIDVSNKPAGLIDKDSNPGSLSPIDLKDGIIIADKDHPWLDREEDDTDQAPTIDVHLDPDDDNGNHTRKFKGYVFEDNRTEVSDKAQVGDGIYTDTESKINGVALELVELVQIVDDNGIATGKYLNTPYKWVEVEEKPTDYLSGSGIPKTVLSEEGLPDNIKVQPKIDTLGKGEYEFRSIVAGDYYIVFHYGDRLETVLTNKDDNEVNQLLGITGSNDKSYNGQDYKSTVYQKGIDQASIPEYNGIKGYVDYNTQNVDNYGNKDNLTQYVRDHYYVYNIALGEANRNISDAKDIYSDRENCNNWSKGADNNVLLNNRAEELQSFEKLLTQVKRNQAENNQSNEGDKTAQYNAIKNMMNNTKMSAQTGVINTEVEYDRTETRYEGNEEIYNYNVEDIDLGLVERPKAALTLSKEVEHVKITNGPDTIFDTTQSVNNFAFTKHAPHDVLFRDRLITGFKINEKGGKTAELLQLHVDDEVIEGALLKIRYAFKVTNQGEVDYKDKKFYYTGETDNSGEDNIVKTNAEAIIDYVSNELKYDPQSQEDGIQWAVATTEALAPDDKDKQFVNQSYQPELKTYNTLLTTQALSGNLTPEIVGEGSNSKETKLTLSTSVDTQNSNLIYNNLAEIIATSNEVGRRNAFSIPGNQKMADQSLGNDAEEGYSSADRIVPDEIDADSAQLFKMVPPTGSDVNYLLIISGVIMVLGLILTSGILLIKATAKNKTTQK